MKNKIILALICIFVLGFGAFSYPAFAEEASRPYAMSISPTEQSIEIDPGVVYRGSFKITNTGTEELELAPAVNPFQVHDYSYDTDISITNQYTEIVDWITFDENYYLLAPGETVIVGFSVNTPLNAHGGSQYAAIGVVTDSGPDEGMIKASHQITSILHADISGNIIKSGSIKEQTINGFLFAPPITTTITSENTGNITIQSTSVLRVTNAITGQEIFNNTNNPVVTNLLPETIREYNVDWDTAPTLGIYNVVLTTTLLNETSTENRTVIICPIWLICVIIGLIVALIVMIIMKKSRESRIKSHGFKFKN